MKKSSRVCTQERPCDWISRMAHDWQDAKGGTCVKHAEELKSHTNCCSTKQNFQSVQAVSSQLKLATNSSCEAKLPGHPVC